MASKRAIRRRACAGKLGHATGQAARRARQGTRTRDPLAVYRCRFCRQWHVGHTPAAMRRAQRQRQEAREC